MKSPAAYSVLNADPVPVTIVLEVDIVAVPVVCAVALTWNTISPCLKEPFIDERDKYSFALL